MTGRLSILIGLAVASYSLAQVPTKATPAAKATGPIPTTAESRPFDAANTLQTPIDLAALGYVEEEFFVSGTGNVYDWAADGAISVKASDRPYATRILVRRPANPSRFSGTAIVEIAHSGRGYDFNPMWGFVWESLIARGDAYVAITANSGNVGALKMFDLKRYESLSFPKPIPDVCAGLPVGGAGGRGRRAAAAEGEEGGATNRPAQFFPPADDSVKWDIISQVGALLKSKSPSKPLAGFNVEVLLATSQTPDDLHTYIRAFHKTANLDNGKPVYDGYLLHEGGGPGPVNSCGGRIAANDPRRMFRNIGVPVMFVITQNYAPRFFSLRREDSDQPGDQFRQYEIAGVSHLNKWPYLYLPAVKDQMVTGSKGFSAPWPYDYQCEPRATFSDFPEPYLIHAMFANLDQWVRKGTPPPRARLIDLKDPGTPQAAYSTDEYGNAAGGLRTPFVDVPAATYANMTGPAQCSEIGYEIPFDSAKMTAFHGGYQNYERKFTAGLDRMVQDRWLLQSDADKLRSEIRSREPKK